MTPYEIEVLRAVAKGNGRFGWYAIEMRLSNVTLTERGHLPDALAELVDRELVRRTSIDGRDCYELTVAGRAALVGEEA